MKLSIILKYILRNYPLIVYADGLPSAFQEVIKYVVGLSTGLAIIATAICILRIMLADDTNQVAEAKGDIKTVLLAWFTLNSAWLIFNTIISLASSLKI